jgi:cell division septation protein DedD
MRHSLLSILLIGFMVGCGPDPDEIVKAENKKLSDLAAAESAKIEEALNRIRTESEWIAKGGTVDVVTTAADLQPDTTVAPAPVVANVTAEATPVTFPHQIQLGAFTNETAAAASASQWEANGFTNVTFFENPDATTAYRFVVRLTGYSGYRSTLTESERINRQFNVKSYPIQVRP